MGIVLYFFTTLVTDSASCIDYGADYEDKNFSDDSIR